MIVVVEGDTDVPFVHKLCVDVDMLPAIPLLDAAGKSNIDKRLVGYARASAGSPYFVVRDLDQDAACAPAWLERNRPADPGRFFLLRLAVRSVEAWFLADVEHAAAALHVKSTQLPTSPDDEADAKLTIVALARRSNKPALQAGLVPKEGRSRKVGPDYERWLIEAAAGWSVDRAAKRSPSLARARAALGRLRVAWTATTA